ncbi:hypothetical protein BJX64DRAFT_282470 [Aspergillus heterothallicus]
MLLPPNSSIRAQDLGRLEELLYSGRAWVSQAPELGLSISISCTPDLDDPIAQFASQLGDSICEAKVNTPLPHTHSSLRTSQIWSELELSTIYKSCIQTQDKAAPKIKLSFGIQSRINSTEPKTTRRVPIILRNLGDFLPPSDVPTACMASVDIHLQYDHKYRRRRARTPSPTAASFLPDKSQKNESFLRAIGPQNSDCTETPLSPRSLSSVTISTDTIFDRNLQKTDMKSAPEESSLSEAWSLQIVSLFQNGFKMLVLGQGKPRREGNLRTPATLQSLSRIAPAVFKPQHLEAMNQRGRLIPSISKSIVSILKLSNNRSLQDKLINIRESFKSDSEAPTSPNIDDDSKMYLQKKLWRIAQKRLYYTPTQRKLKSRRFFLEWSQDRQQRDDDMLLEELVDGTEYTGDVYDAYNDCSLGYGLLTHPGDETFEPALYEQGECDSSMIFEDSEADQLVAAMGDGWYGAGIDQDVGGTIADQLPEELSAVESSDSFEDCGSGRDALMEEGSSSPISPPYCSSEAPGEHNGEMLLDEVMEDYL